MYSKHLRKYVLLPIRNKNVEECVMRDLEIKEIKKQLNSKEEIIVKLFTNVIDKVYNVARISTNLQKKRRKKCFLKMSSKWE